MSYEGSVKILCKQGHLTEVDCYCYSSDDWKCQYCNEEKAWENNIDQTNYSSCSYPVLCGVFPLEKIQDKIMEKCECCEHEKMISPEVYKIPTKEEEEKYRNSSEYKKKLKQEENALRKERWYGK